MWQDVQRRVAAHQVRRWDPAVHGQARSPRDTDLRVQRLGSLRGPAAPEFGEGSRTADAPNSPDGFSADDYRRAAVLVGLQPGGPDPQAEGAPLSVVLTRRSDALPEHAGQVALPGGRVDDSDASVLATALRETHEEIGVPPSAVEIAGLVDAMVTPHGYHVVPVVGRVAPEVSFRPDPREVERVFLVPLVALMDDNGWEQREHVYRGVPVPVWHFPWDNEDIWGVTGHILRSLVGVLRASGTRGEA